ncbi:hypothetical protein PsYK624_051870 [Phanerochaete sordida]|uniref:Uncharacterized protein n=1 Tax=Phanerochaete sordida TaxID=48140 RepID=A0A9P3LBD6_9APHY|nr:hypothetical protein PsYK624_051870 [Phanerochaete sordida]
MEDMMQTDSRIKDREPPLGRLNSTCVSTEQTRSSRSRRPRCIRSHHVRPLLLCSSAGNARCMSGSNCFPPGLEAGDLESASRPGQRAEQRLATAHSGGHGGHTSLKCEARGPKSTEFAHLRGPRQ